MSDKQQSAFWLAKVEDGQMPHTGVNAFVGAMRTQQETFKSWCFDQAQIYGLDLSAFGGPGYPASEDAYSVNVLANIVDTLHSQLADRILPMPLTTGGDYRQIERAKNLGHFIKGAFQESGFFDTQLAVDLSTLIFGIGWVMGETTREERMGACYVPPWEMFVDDTEARYGRPRTIVHEFIVDRGVLLEMYERDDDALFGGKSDRAAAIERGSSSSVTDRSSTTTSDMVLVRQAYHLPSGPSASDGRVCVCTSAGTLYFAEWKRKTFPYRWQVGTVPMGGIRGDSLVRRLAPAQAQLDKLNEKIDVCHELMGVPRIILQKASKVSTTQINDIPGRFITVDGAPPTEWNAQPVHADTYAFRGIVKDDMNTEAGVSGMSSQSQVPAGLRNASGIALQTFEDVDSRRHKVRHRLREKFVLEVADMFIEMAEDQGESYEVKAITGKSVKKLRWSDVRMDRDAYVLDVMPTSFLAKTPSARFAQLREMRDSQDITPQQFKQLLDMPDLEQEAAIDVADFTVVKMALDVIVFEGRYVSPEPFDDFAVAKDLTRKFINYYRANGADEETLAMLRQYADEVVRLEQMANPPPQAGPPGMPPDAGGAPPDGGAMPPEMMMPPGAAMGAA